MKTTYPYTRRIKWLGVGTDEQQGRYLVLRIGEQRIVMRVGNLRGNQGRGDEPVRLERAGVPLIAGPAQSEFISRAQDEAGKAPTFRIVTKAGWDGPNFYFPDRVVPKRATQVEFYLDDSLSGIHRRYQRAGTRAGTNELLSLCRHNSRLLPAHPSSRSSPTMLSTSGRAELRKLRKKFEAT